MWSGNPSIDKLDVTPQTVRTNSPAGFVLRWTVGTVLPLTTLAVARFGLVPGWPSDRLLDYAMPFWMAVPAFAIGMTFLVNYRFLQRLDQPQRGAYLCMPLIVAPLFLALMLAVISEAGIFLGIMTILMVGPMLSPWGGLDSAPVVKLASAAPFSLVFPVCGWLSGFALSLTHMIAAASGGAVATEPAGTGPASLGAVHRRGGAVSSVVLLACYVFGARAFFKHNAEIGLGPSVLLAAALPLAALPHALAAARVIARDRSALARAVPTATFLGRLAVTLMLILAATAIEGWLRSTPSR